jgi:ABC-2 type transport system permease protein
MSLWRLEWLRLVRTRRLMAIAGIYVFFGLTGPLSARYLSAIMGRVGTKGVRIEFPPPVPADGIAQFASNASQIGLLVVVMVAASALAFDARREMAVFLRTRVDSVRTILIPAFTVNASAAAAGLVIGSLTAWYETAVLLGSLPTWRMLAGVAYGALFLVFAVATVAAVAAVIRGVLAAAGVTLVVLLILAILGTIEPLGRWLPTTLAGAMAALVRTASPADYLPAAGIAAMMAAALVWFAIVMGSRREL